MKLARLSRDDSGDIVFKNAKWHPLDVIDCEVQFEETGEEWFEYTASPNDEVDQGRELFQQLSTTYIAQVAPATAEDRKAFAVAELEAQRREALADSDWIACTDVELENQDEWLEYRQALRDIPSQLGYPFQVEMPERPSQTKNTFHLGEGARNADGTYKSNDPNTPD